MHARPTPVLIKPGRICINNICVEEMHLLKGIVVGSVGKTALCTKFQCLWSLLAGNHNKSQLKPRPPADGNPALCFLPTPTKPSDKLLRYFMKNASVIWHRQVYLINLAHKPFKTGFLTEPCCSFAALKGNESKVCFIPARCESYVSLIMRSQYCLFSGRHKSQSHSCILLWRKRLE